MPVDGFIGLFFHGTTETGTTGARQVKYADIMLSTLDYNEYEPVESNVYEIDFGGGYAGGKYNLLTGELTIEWQLMNLNGTENWMLFDCQNTAYKRMRLMNPINTVEPPPNNDTVANIICSHYDTVTAGQTYLQVKGVAVQQWDDQNPDLICFYDPAYQTVESWKAHLAQLNAAGTPIAIAYKMRTPIKTQVPPPDIRPLPGYNAISSFYGNIYAKWTASGWRTVSDQTRIEEALGQAQTEIDKNNNRIEEVNTNLESRVRLDSYGLHVGDSSTNNEILLQSGGVPEIHFVIDGKTAGKIGASFHQFGNMELRVPQAKGFVMQAIEE